MKTFLDIVYTICFIVGAYLWLTGCGSTPEPVRYPETPCHERGDEWELEPWPSAPDEVSCRCLTQQGTQCLEGLCI